MPPPSWRQVESDEDGDEGLSPTHSELMKKQRDREALSRPKGRPSLDSIPKIGTYSSPPATKVEPEGKDIIPMVPVEEEVRCDNIILSLFLEVSADACAFQTCAKETDDGKPSLDSIPKIGSYTSPDKVEIEEKEVSVN